MENRLEAGFCSCLVRAQGGLDELVALGMQAAGQLGAGYLRDI